MTERPLGVDAMRMWDIVGELIGERTRQVTEEGNTPEVDDTYPDHTLRNAASIYAMHPDDRHHMLETGETIKQDLWPWGRDAFKPKDARRDLVRAGGLILAAIEKIDREKGR